MDNKKQTNNQTNTWQLYSIFYSYHTLSLCAHSRCFLYTALLRTHFHSSKHMCEKFRASRHCAESADRDPSVRVRTAASTCSARLALGSLSLMELRFCSRAASLSKQAPGSSETVFTASFFLLLLPFLFFFLPPRPPQQPPFNPPPLYFTTLTSRDVNMI